MFNLAVLNAGGRDPEQHFPGGAGNPEAVGVPHPPINFHAFAACTDGSFHTGLRTLLATGRPVLLLLRGPRHLSVAYNWMRYLKKAGRTVAVTFKEAGSIQVAAQYTRAADLRRLAAVLDLADGCLAPTPFLMDFFDLARPPAADPALPRRLPVADVPTPYPVDDPRWDFSVPPNRRRGVFVGTREFDTPSRQHLAAILAARRLHNLTNVAVTVINPDGRRGAKTLAALGFSADPDARLRLLPGPLPYVEYLRAMARHRIVFQLDRSGVPGQVAGDALLCRLPCVGGDGAIEQIAFPDLAGHDKDPARLVEVAAAVLSDGERYEKAWRDGQTRAQESLSFRAVARRLAAFYEELGAGQRL